MNDEQLRDAPERLGEADDPSLDPAWEEHVHRYFNASPYWGAEKP